MALYGSAIAAAAPAGIIWLNILQVLRRAQPIVCSQVPVHGQVVLQCTYGQQRFLHRGTPGEACVRTVLEPAAAASSFSVAVASAVGWRQQITCSCSRTAACCPASSDDAAVDAAHYDACLLAGTTALCSRSWSQLTYVPSGSSVKGAAVCSVAVGCCCELICCDMSCATAVMLLWPVCIGLRRMLHV
jgi:hypothetical protein